LVDERRYNGEEIRWDDVIRIGLGRKKERSYYKKQLTLKTRKEPKCELDTVGAGVRRTGKDHLA